MFRGISSVNIDDKGRMAIPSRYRSVLEKEAKGQLITTIDTEQHCLLLYPIQEWELIESKLQALPSFDPAVRRIQRLLIGHASEAELDGNGRILLPAPLREYAQLDKEAVLIGQGKKFEIWSQKNWDKCREDWISEHLTDKEVPPELRGLSL